MSTDNIISDEELDTLIRECDEMKSGGITMRDIDMDIMTDEELSEMIQEVDPDYEYDKYRDDWSDSLHEALKEVYKDFVEVKKLGYYKDNPTRFLEHAISDLKEIAKCDLVAYEGNITATKRKPVTVEFVQPSFEETELKVKNE